MTREERIKSVHVRGYWRFRNEKWEYVNSHKRSHPRTYKVKD